jgi:hypothetical protein
MSIAIDGKKEEIPGLWTRSFLDDPSIALTREDCGPRPGRRIRQFIVHTTKGKYPQFVLPESGKGGGARANVDYWSRDHRSAGAHILIDTNGAVYCAADLTLQQTWHAGSEDENANPLSIGIEIVQRSDGALWRPQIESLVTFLDWGTRRLTIQRQIPDKYRGPLKRFDVKNGWDLVGIFGHRDVTRHRGRGDPGDIVFDFSNGLDLERWKPRQTVLGLRGKSVDGVALDETCALLKKDPAHPRGLWVQRPGD